MRIIDVAIVGAGPYGLSIAACLQQSRSSFRIFGQPMQSWRHHMPPGMQLKSEGLASNLFAPASGSTLREFCADRGLPYADRGVPVPLDTFVDYGLTFQKLYVPTLEEKCVDKIERGGEGFHLQLRGESVAAKNVILAVGIGHFDHVPAPLAGLPSKLVSHSYRLGDMRQLRGKDVAVVGGGASAIDTCVALARQGVTVRLITRRRSLSWNATPDVHPSLWRRMVHPPGGLGSGWKLRFCEYPALFRQLPSGTRQRIVETCLGPSGGWAVKDAAARLPQYLGCTIDHATAENGRVLLRGRTVDGQFAAMVDHVIAATGYRVALERLPFLDASLRDSIQTRYGMPVLRANFESSVPGLYFVGLAASHSFGPIMRFVLGARYTARVLSRQFA